MLAALPVVVVRVAVAVGSPAGVLATGTAVRDVAVPVEAERLWDGELVDPAHEDSSTTISSAIDARNPCCMRLSESADMETTPTPEPRRAMLERLDKAVPFWGPQFVVLGAILLDLGLPERLTIGPRWLLPSLEAALLLGLVMASPNHLQRHSPARRRVAVGLIGLVSATNIVSLVLLCHELLHGAVKNGRPLIGAGILLWVTNVLLFGLWYWELDRGGPLARALGRQAPPDFLFPQMANPEHAPENWKPGLLDYLYVSFTNATAFSPTDTMPLTASAKWLMTAQSLSALVTIGLVVARAVNILQ